MRKFKSEDVEFELEVEQDEGNMWAWASVVVRAKWAGFVGYGSIGCVSRKRAEDFDGFYDLAAEAVHNLVNVVREAGWEFEVTEEQLEAAARRGGEEAKKKT